ncbi:hypothetical protein QYM36_015003, partial [Artemia franciscana]
MDREPPAPPHMTLNRCSGKDLCSGTHTDDLCLDEQTKMTGVYILAKDFIENREAIILRTGRIFLGRYLTKEFSKHECKGNYGLISQRPGPGGSVEIIEKSEEIPCKQLALKDLKVENVTLLFERKYIRNAQQIKNKRGIAFIPKGFADKEEIKSEIQNNPEEITLPFTVKNEVGLINIKLEEKIWLPVVNYYNRATVDFDLNQFKRVNDYCENDKFIGGDFNLHNKMWDTTSQQDQQSFAFADYILEPDSNLCLITPCDLGIRLNVTNGQKNPTKIPILLKKDGMVFTASDDKMKILLDNFIKNDQGYQYQASTNITTDNNTQPQMEPFTIDELETAIKKIRPGAPGPDQIHNLMLKNLPEEGKNILLILFNKSIKEGYTPKEWRKTTIIPIPKTGKDPSNPDSYRPISLPSCLCKLMEHLIKNIILGLVIKAAQKEQFGFLPNRNTTDCLVRLEDQIKQGFRSKKDTFAVFLDMKSAFDQVDLDKLLKKVGEIGIPANCISWISSFLRNREVRAASSRYSTNFHIKHDLGLPQGGVLSPILFVIYCSDLDMSTVLRCKTYIYADDIALVTTGKTPIILQSVMQKALNNVQQWCSENNMTLSPEKTVGMLFSKNNNTAVPQVNVVNQPIRLDDSFCYLGLIFYSKMAWLRQIEYLLGNIRSRLNLINVMCLGKRCAPFKCLSKIIKTVIVSKLDYGSFIYGDASQKNLKNLDTVFQSVLRQSIACLNSTPIPATIELG